MQSTDNWTVQRAYYVIIAVGALSVLIYMVRAFTTESKGKLDPPQVLQQRVLRGASVDEQLAAAKGLIQHGAKARKEVRQTLAASRQNAPEVRVCLLQAVMQIQDWRSIAEIFEAMGDPDAAVRGAAAAAAVTIMGVDDGFRANDPPEKREKIREQMRREFDKLKSRYVTYYSDQEE